MKTFTLESLIDFGINRLTGEACAFGRRVLCDLNEDGRELLADFFSISSNAFNENWNSRVGKKEAVASIMLDRHFFKDILIFALLREGWEYIIEHNVDHISLTATNKTEEILRWQENTPGLRVIRNWSGPNSFGTRNMHQMSGRIA